MTDQQIRYSWRRRKRKWNAILLALTPFLMSSWNQREESPFFLNPRRHRGKSSSHGPRHYLASSHRPVFHLLTQLLQCVSYSAQITAAGGSKHPGLQSCTQLFAFRKPQPWLCVLTVTCVSNAMCIHSGQSRAVFEMAFAFWWGSMGLLGPSQGRQHKVEPLQLCTTSTATSFDQVCSSSYCAKFPKNAGNDVLISSGQQQKPVLLCNGYVTALSIPL